MDVKRRLSLLWLVVMLNMIYADILSITREMATGEMPRIENVAIAMLVAALVLQVPIWMVFLSRVLERGRNRLSNLIAAVLTIAFVVGPEIADPGPTELHYHLLAGVEVLCLIAILRLVWTWKDGGAADGGTA